MSSSSNVDPILMSQSSSQLNPAVPIITLGICIFSSFYLYWHTQIRGGNVLQRVRTFLKISEIEEITGDTKRIRLAFPRSGMKLGLPVGKHFKIYGDNSGYGMEKWNGRDDPESTKKEIERQYTPTTGDEVSGYVDLVIKMYRPGVFQMPDGKELKFENGGKMSGCYLDKKQIGDLVEINGPFGLIEYKGYGGFKLPGVKELRKFKSVNMMAGGSGITPMLQILQAVVRENESAGAGNSNSNINDCQFRLIYANKTENDILCKDQLLELEKAGKGRIKIDFTLDFPPEKWRYSSGFITQDMIKKDLAGADCEPLTLLCGPPPMVEFACKRNLSALGYKDENVVCF